MFLFNKAFGSDGHINKEINQNDYIGEEIVYSLPASLQIEHLSEVSEWLSTMVDFIGGPILSGALLAQTVAIVSGGRLSPFSISKPDGLYSSMCHPDSNIKGFFRVHHSDHDGKIAIIDDVLYQGRTLSHAVDVLRSIPKQIEAIVVFKLLTYHVKDLPDNLQKYSDKIWVLSRE